MSLLELVITTAMLATLVTAVVAVIRSSQNAWDGQQSDRGRLQAAHAVVRHITRQVRQAEAITVLDPSGGLVAQVPGGASWTWSHVGSQVQFSDGVATEVLADGIESLALAGYEMDAATPAATTADVQLIRITATVRLDREINDLRTVQAWVWKRSW